MALGLSIDAWERILSLLKDDSLTRMYMTGDTDLIRVLRVAKFDLLVLIHKHGADYDLTALHAMFPNVSTLLLDRHSRSYDVGRKKTGINPFRLLPQVKFQNLRHLEITFLLPEQLSGHKTSEFIGLFPALQVLDVKIDVADMNRFLRHLPPNLLKLLLVVKLHRKFKSAVTLDVAALPRTLVGFKVERPNGVISIDTSQPVPWPPSLTSIHLSGSLSLDVLKSLPRTLEYVSCPNYESDEEFQVLPYSAFPPSTTYIYLGNHPVMLDAPLNPDTILLMANVHWTSVGDLNRFALPLPKKLLYIGGRVVRALARSSPDPVDFILHLPTAFNCVDFVKDLHGLEVNGSPFDAYDFRAKRMKFGVPPNDVVRSTWIDRLDYLTRAFSWSSRLEHLTIGVDKLIHLTPLLGGSHSLDAQIVDCLLRGDTSDLWSVEFGESFHEFDDATITSTLQWLSSSAHAVEDVSICWLSMDRILPIMQTIPTQSHSVRRLIIENVNCSLEDGTSLASHFPCLRKLRISTDWPIENDVSRDVVVGFRSLKIFCPNLKKIGIGLQIDSMSPRLSGYLDEDFAAHLPPKLKSLVIVAPNFAYRQDNFEARVFPFLPRTLKKLVLRIDHVTSRGHKLQLELKPKTLRRFEVEEYYWCDHEFFCDCHDDDEEEDDDEDDELNSQDGGHVYNDDGNDDE
jgi:hypothetical protein